MDMETRKHLASRVQPARKERRWTQKELAENAGVSLGAVSAAERGTVVPQTAILRAILGALGLDPGGNGRECGSRALCEWCSSLPPDVKVMLDVVGLYLVARDPAEREAEFRRIAGGIVGGVIEPRGQ